MTLPLKHIFVVAVMCVLSLPLSSQVRRMCIENPTRHNHLTYVNVYEYDYVDIQPQFPGGEHGLVNFINKTREYPYHAYKQRVQGRVLCSFIVGKDGKISDIKVIRGAGNESLNREAMRVIKEMPRWKAGKVNNRKVPVRCVLPIAFRL